MILWPLFVACFFRYFAREVRTVEDKFIFSSILSNLCPSQIWNVLQGTSKSNQNGDFTDIVFRDFETDFNQYCHERVTIHFYCLWELKSNWNWTHLYSMAAFEKKNMKRLKLQIWLQIELSADRFNWIWKIPEGNVGLINVRCNESAGVVHSIFAYV